VTNFSAKTDFQGSRENLHLVERFTRTGPQTLQYEVTIEDPTVWTQPWTVKEEFTKQSDEENRLYYEPRCIEGNFGLPGLLHGRRVEELAFAQGRGPDPRTIDNVKGGFLLQMHRGAFRRLRQRLEASARQERPAREDGHALPGIDFDCDCGAVGVDGYGPGIR
jgi:hypothetical protein